jgi:AAHS family 4-hydroxybenzoate transporter-like MFS transporter
MFAVYALGVALAGALAVMLAEEHGWRSVFIVGGAVPLLIGLVLFLYLPESIEFIVEKGRDVARATALLRRMVPGLKDDWYSHVTVTPKTGTPVSMLFQSGRAPVTLLIWFLFAMNLAEIGLFSSWLPTMLQHAGQPVPLAIRSAISFQMGGLVAGIVMGLLLIGRTGARLVAVLLVAEIAATILIVALGLSLHSVPAAVVFSFLVGMFVGGSTAGLNGFTATFYPTAMRATGHGSASAAGRLAGTVGPMLGGALMASGLSVPAIFLWIAVPPLLGTIAIVALLRLQKGGGAEQRPRGDFATGKAA